MRILSLCFCFLAAPALAQMQAGIDTEVAIEGYNNEPISTYSPQADFVKLGRGVGLLRIETDGGSFPCTAFLVSETHLLTNFHCVPGVLDHPEVNATRILSVTWFAGFTRPGRIEEAEPFEVVPEPVEMSEPLDYAVLAVKGDPAARYPVLPLTGSAAQEGMPYWIIGHPEGKAQRISREGCRAAGPPIEGNRLRHTCDTLGGNSGSPMFDSSSRQVIGLHHAGSSRLGVNFGVPMAMILEQSEVLKVAAPAPARPLPLVMALFPRAAGVGDEISVSADAPAGCTPAFYNVAPSGKVTPIPAEIFQQVVLSDLQTRYQVTPGGRYGLVVQPQDEKGRHSFGFACAPDGADPRQWLRPVIEAVVAGDPTGEVPLGGATLRWAFQSYEVE